MNQRDQEIIEAWRNDDLETMARELAVIQAERAWRPRDDDDADIHPESYRASVLRLLDAWEAMPKWLRFLSRVMAWRPFFRRPAAGSAQGEPR